MEFRTRIITCDLMNWAAAGPGHPSLSPAHAEPGPGTTVTFLQDLGLFLSSLLVPQLWVALTRGELTECEQSDGAGEKISLGSLNGSCQMCTWDQPLFNSPQEMRDSLVTFSSFSRGVEVRGSGHHFSEVLQNNYSVLFTPKRLWASCRNTKERKVERH